MADDKRTLPGTRIRDLRGEVFGRLTVLAYAGVTRTPLRRPNGHRDVRVRHDWQCHCLCGRHIIVWHHALLSGDNLSCGCLRRELNIKRKRTHGKSDTSMYRRWNTMRERCNNPRNAKYPNYGGRGITVCQDWQDSFTMFLADVGEPPFHGASIERIDNNQGYFPENVRWASRSEQQRNTSGNHLLTFQGKTQTLVAWCEELALPYFTIAARLNRQGWSVDRALSTPISPARKKGTQ